MKKTGKVVIGTTEIDTFSGETQTVFVDFLSEADAVDGIIRISFVQVSNDLGGAPTGVIGPRIRMTATTATILRNALDNILGPQNLPDSAKN